MRENEKSSFNFIVANLGVRHIKYNFFNFNSKKILRFLIFKININYYYIFYYLIEY